MRSSKMDANLAELNHRTPNFFMNEIFLIRFDRAIDWSRISIEAELVKWIKDDVKTS